MAHVAITARPRTELGNGPTRRLRREGLVPGIVYEPGTPSIPLAVDARELRRAIADGAATGVIDLTIEGGSTRPVLIKEWQLHPVRGEVTHIDFQEVNLRVAIQASVAVSLVGSAVGVRDGGVLDQTMREVDVTALPDDLPDLIELDVSELGVGDSVTVADMTAPAGVTIDSDPEATVASVVPPTVEVEEPDEEVQPDLVEGEDDAETE
ncbi:MAG: 50S ribosomal protein L25 [Miltoncostaeaceae bacterium]